MRMTRTWCVICCVAVLGLPSLAGAAAGDVVGAGSDFLAAKAVRAKFVPQIWTVFSIPGEIVSGETYRVDCTIEAYKKPGGKKPKAKVEGTVALLLVSLDVGSGTWTFDGVTGSGIPFKTDKTGVAFATTGPVVATSFFDAPGTNDTITGWANFTGGPKIKQIFFRCELVHVMAAAIAP